MQVIYTAADRELIMKPESDRDQRTLAKLKRDGRLCGCGYDPESGAFSYAAMRLTPEAETDATKLDEIHAIVRRLADDSASSLASLASRITRER